MIDKAGVWMPVLAATLLAAGALHAQTAPAQDVPLRGKGPWVAAFEDSMCVLSRSYESGGETIDLAFRPIPGDKYLEIALVMPGAGKQFNRGGKAEVTLAPGGQKGDSEYRDYTIREGKLRVIRFTVEREQISELESAKSIRLLTGKRTPPLHFALVGTAKAMATIQTCQDDLVRSWGFDPEALRTLARPAEPATSPQNWVSNSDYPEEALRKDLQGSTRFRLEVGVDGRVEGCKINQSSGVPLLDEAACRLMMKRARFKPAIGADGKPVRVPWSSTFTWHSPG